MMITEEENKTAIGEILAGARSKQGISPKDVEKNIKIRAKYITALERDEFDTIPGHAYVIGFIKTYADFLGLDGSQLVEKYKEDHQEEIQKANVFAIGDRGREKKMTPVFPIIIILAAAIIITVILQLSGVIKLT